MHPFGVMLPQGSRVRRWILPWFALVLVAASLMCGFAGAACEGASCLWSCRHQSVTSIPSRVKALRKSFLVDSQAPGFQGVRPADLHARLFSVVGNASELVCDLFEDFFHFRSFRRIISISLA